MADMIKCPSCGESNPSNQEFCQYCRSHLTPQAGSDNSSIKSGQLPTKKNTAELEPILPQWLRDARDNARKSAENDAVQSANQQQAIPPASKPDLLAGLQSQSDNDEEDVPDWLASITGSTPKTKKTQADASEVRWVELGDAKDFAKDEPASDSDTPSWLAGLAGTDPQADEKDELTDWFRTASNSDLPPQPTKPAPANNTPSSDGTTDWLKQMAAESMQDDGTLFSDSNNSFKESFKETPASDTPDWLRQMAADDGTQNSEPLFNESKPIFDSSPSDTPDWLKQMGAQDDAQNIKPSPSISAASFSPPPANDTPDWLRQMAAQDDAPDNSASFGNSNNKIDPAPLDTPDWLKSMAAQDDAPDNAPAWLKPTSAQTDATSADTSIDAPDWLRAMGGAQDSQTQSADTFSFPESSVGESDAAVGSTSDEFVPDWLKGLPAVENDQPLQAPTPSWLKEESNIPAADAEVPSWLSGAPAQAKPAENEPDLFAMDNQESLGDLPSWLQAAAPQSSVYDAPAVDLPASPASSSSDTPDWLDAFKSTETPKPTPAFSIDEPIESPSAFTTNPLGENNADALFTDMPDWLSNASEASASSNPTAITNSDVIAPGELPSWVQAMRPVDSGTPARSFSTSLSSDQTLESRGALAGLQGVLPSVPGYTPTSKPKAYSIKLQSSDEQQSHAALLEQILAAETEPVPIESFSVLRASRSLRWALSFIFLAALITVLAARTQIFSLPIGAPPEIGGAIQVAQSIPEGAPVLVAFDYEPARIGEMEAVAAPLFNLMRKPSLTFISTNESGALLAERFTSGPLAGFLSNNGISYLNLGYLPGSQIGIRAFAQTPSTTMPQLTGFGSISNFAALIIITDNADDARTWIEQTASVRGAMPIVIASSAQAAPMLQPYYESQQINGLVSGLYGSAILESNNVNSTGTARIYWDAFSVGMLLAMVFILVGGLINLALGLRDRAVAREEK